MPGWVEEGYKEYSRRLGQDIRLELVEIPSESTQQRRRCEASAGKGSQPDAGCGRTGRPGCYHGNQRAKPGAQSSSPTKWGTGSIVAAISACWWVARKACIQDCMAQADLRWSLSPSDSAAPNGSGNCCRTGLPGLEYPAKSSIS